MAVTQRPVRASCLTFSGLNRLLKFGGAKRIFFLVDTRNLGKQAHQEFMAYSPPDDERKFTELYNVQRLASSAIDPQAQVVISTIQRMYSVLSGEPLDESAEDVSLAEVQLPAKPARLVRYNPAAPMETFDFIVIDECHRSIYNLWKQVLDYFDASLIGLVMGVVPHVAQNTASRRSAVPDAIAQSEGYAVSQQNRKLIEQVFGWAKTVDGIRQVMVRGLERVDPVFVLMMAAYNLTRMRTLGEIRS